MSRTRIVFFVMLAAVLVILGASLSARLISEATLMQIFIACTIFGIGIMALDFLGILGHQGGDDFAGAGDGGDAGHMDFDGAHGGHDDAGGHDADHDGAHDADHDGFHDADDGTHGHTQPVASGIPLLSALSYLRQTVYFSIGFGPVGLAALLSGTQPLLSLVLAVPAGLVTIVVARAFFRFQRHDTGRVTRPAELLRQHATVIVPLDHLNMGKVRVQMGMSVYEQYAVAADPGASFAKGESVMIVRVTDDCVYVA